MDSDSEIAKDFNELAAMGRNRTRKRQSSEYNPHYIPMDAPTFIDADGTPSQDEEWWVSSFIEESDEDSSPTVQTSPEVCTLSSSQVVPGETASFNQGNVASADSDSSSSSSSTIDFIPASTALSLLPDDIASTDSDSSISSTSTIDFVTASSDLPLVPVDRDLARLPPASPNQLMSIAVQPFGDGSDQMMSLAPEPDSDDSVQPCGSDQMMPMSPEADSDDSDDSDFTPLFPDSPNRSLSTSAGPLSTYSDYDSPSVTFDQGAPTTDDTDLTSLPPTSPSQLLSISDGSLSTYSEYATAPSVSFDQDDSYFASVPSVSANQSLSISDGSLSTYSEYATAPSVSFDQDDSYFASVPSVSPNQSLSMSDGSLSTYSEYATAPSVSFDQDDSYFASVPSVSANQSLSMSDGSLSTCSDFETLPLANFNQDATTADGGPNAAFTPFPMADLSFSPPSRAVANQRNLISGRNPCRRARRARRSLNFASPNVKRASNILPAVQATALSGQQLPAPADDDFASLPCVDFKLPQVPVCAASADYDFIPLPHVAYNLPPQVPDGKTSPCTEFVPLPYSIFNRGVPMLPSAADAAASSMNYFAPLFNVSRNHGAPTSLSVAVPNQRSAVSRRYSLSRSPRRRRRTSDFFSSAAASRDQESAGVMALRPAVSLHPSRSVLPPGAIPKRRGAVLRSCAVSHAPLQQRPRRDRRGLNLAPPASRLPAIKPPDEMFPVERRGIIQAAVSRNQQSDEEKSLLVIGEIAFQLDRRILSYIFVGQPRLYGFRVEDINERINEVAGSDLQRDEMLARNTEIMNTLSNYGYCPVIHSIFAEFIVNNFGILKEKPRQEMVENYNNRDYLYKLIAEFTPPALLQNMLVLLNSLWHLSVADGKPMFIW